jgi:hypothetical protein
VLLLLLLPPPPQGFAITTSIINSADMSDCTSLYKTETINALSS